MPIAEGTAAIIGGALSAAGGTAAGIASGKANRRGVALARENREWQENENAKNRAFAVEQMDRSREWSLEDREYDSAVNQRARLEEAGLNPYMMMNGGSAGSSASGTPPLDAGNTSAPNHFSPRPVDISASFTGVASIINQLAQARKTALESQGQSMDNYYKGQFGEDLIRSEIANRVNGNLEQIAPAYWSRRMSEAPNLVGVDLRSRYLDFASQQVALETNAAQSVLMRLDVDKQQILNKYLNQQQQAELFSKIGMYYRDMWQGNLSQSSIKKNLAETVLGYARANGIRIQNKVADATASSLIDAMNQENASNAQYYNSFKFGAGQVALNDIITSNLSREQAAFVRKMAEWQEQLSKIELTRERHSPLNSKGYYGTRQVFRDFIGDIVGAAAAGFAGGKAFKVGSRSRSSSHGWSLSTPNYYY